MKHLLKKSLLLLALMGGASSVWADDTYTASFTDATWTQSTAGYFTSEGSKNSPNANYAGKYNGVSYSKGLKMESDTKVQFTTTRSFDITIVRSTAKNPTKTIKFGTATGTKSDLAFGDALSDTNNENVAVATLTNQTAGTYQIVRGDGEAGIVFVSVTEKGTLTTPTITVDPTSASIKATESGVKVTQNVAVSGSNLTGNTLTATLSPAVTGLSVTLGSSSISEGAISTTATLHYTQTVNASGSTTLTLSDGTTSKNVTVNYTSKVAPTVLAAVSSTTITSMDLSKVGTSGMETLTTDDGYVVLSDAGATTSFADNLAVSCIAGVGVTWRGDAVQGPLFKFKTTVPGTVTVKFSDVGTSSDRANRYANVNGTRTDVYSTTSASGGVKTSSPIEVSAGEVIIKGQVQGDGDTYTDNQIRVYTITFTPTVSATIGSTGWTTFSSAYPLDLSNMTASTGDVTAYYASETGADCVIMTPTNSSAVIANEGLMLKGSAGATITIPVAASAGSALSGNMLVGCCDGESIEAGSSKYVLVNNGGTAEFECLDKNGATIPAGKAYLDVSLASPARSLRIVFAGDITGINEAAATAEAAQKDGKFVINGQLVIFKNGKKFNAAGAQLY